MTDRAPTAPRPRRRRPRVPGWAVPLVILAVLLAGEAAARVVGPNIDRKAGTEERAFIKADQMYARSGPTNVAILGSSETAGGLIPSAIDAEAPHLTGTYNAALAGTFLPTYRDWAEQVVVPALDPDVMVIGMLPMTVADIEAQNTPSYTEPRAAYRSAFDQIGGGQLGGLNWRLRQHSALIRYRPYLRQPTTLVDGLRTTLSGGLDDPAPIDGPVDWKTETSPARLKAATDPDGAVADYQQPSIPTDADPVGAAIYQELTKGTLNLDGIDGFVSWLRAEGIVPVIVVLPVDRGPLEAGGADLSTLDGWSNDLEAWANDHGVPVRNAFTETWAPELFHDRNHLDAAGAQRLSAEVGSWLEELCTTGQLHDGCASGTS